jgi:hypothetical protein
MEALLENVKTQNGRQAAEFRPTALTESAIAYTMIRLVSTSPTATQTATIKGVRAIALPIVIIPHCVDDPD